MNRSFRSDETTTRTMESKYPTLDEVDVIPMPSLGDAFRYAEERTTTRGELERPRSRQQSPPHTTTTSSSSRRSATSSGSSKEKQRERQASAETPSVSNPSQKQRPTLQRLKSSDVLDTKPAAVMRPAATPGAVEVNHAPYFMDHHQQQQRHHQESHCCYETTLSRQASAGSQRSGGGSRGSRRHSSSSSGSAPAAPFAASFPRMELEVSPGIFLPLHGSEETYAALRSDRLCATYCLACETPLFCVEYAAQVLCPACRVVSPVFTHEAPRRSRNDAYGSHPAAGVGLGMTVDEYDRTWAEAEERIMLAERYYGGGRGGSSSYNAY